MSLKIEESVVVINQALIDGKKLKKSQIEQFPYISDANWMREVRDGHLEIICTFSPQIYIDIASKRNKNKAPYRDGEMTMIFSTDARANRGVILYDKNEGILFVALLRCGYLTSSSFVNIKGINEETVLNWIKSKPYVADL